MSRWRRKNRVRRNRGGRGGRGGDGAARRFARPGWWRRGGTLDARFVAHLRQVTLLAVLGHGSNREETQGKSQILAKIKALPAKEGLESFVCRETPSNRWSDGAIVAAFGRWSTFRKSYASCRIPAPTSL
jgi:hypothetical protein